MFGTCQASTEAAAIRKAITELNGTVEDVLLHLRLISRLLLRTEELNTERLKQITMKVTELSGELKAVTEQLAAVRGENVLLREQLIKSRNEILGKIADLEGKLSNVVLPTDATEALTALKAEAQAQVEAARALKPEVQSQDDIVPDPAPETPNPQS